MLTILELPIDGLFDEKEQPINIKDIAGLIILVNFWSIECPTCQQTDLELSAVRQEFPNIMMVAVLSNQNEDPETAKTMFRSRGYDKLWIDHRAAFAHAVSAITTPSALLFDSNGDLRYRGAINDKTFRKRVREINYIQNALSQLSAGLLVDPAETPAYGCAIVDVSPDE